MWWWYLWLLLLRQRHYHFMTTKLSQNRGRVPDLCIVHLIEIGQINKIVVDGILGDMLGRLVVGFPGRIDHCDNIVIVQIFTQFHPIITATATTARTTTTAAAARVDNPGKLGNSHIVPVTLHDLRCEPGKQMAMKFRGDAGEKYFSGDDFSECNGPVVRFLGGQSVQNGSQLADVWFS